MISSSGMGCFKYRHAEPVCVPGAMAVNGPEVGDRDLWQDLEGKSQTVPES